MQLSMVNKLTAGTLLLGLFVVLAQSDEPTSPPRMLGSGDFIALTVSHSTELSHPFHVAEDGMLHLPLLSRPIVAEGLSPEELERDIETALKAEHLFVAPVAAVKVVRYSNKTITVMGAVRRPLTFRASAETTLLDALARAWGVSAEAGSSVLVTRPKGTGPDLESITVELKPLLENPGLAGNLRLHGGEQIRVPEAPKVYVLGNVGRPRVVLIKDPADATVLRVLAQAGVAPHSSGEAVIYRHTTSGSKQTVISIKRILKGKSADVRLQSEDVLYIPRSRGLRLAAGMVDAITRFGSKTVSGFQAAALKLHASLRFSK